MDDEANEIASAVQGRSCARCFKDIFDDDNPQYSEKLQANVCAECYEIVEGPIIDLGF